MARVKTSSKPTRAAAAPKKTPRARTAKTPMSVAEVMAALEKAGSDQTRKTYRRHGCPEPMFGVAFSTLKTLYKRIGVDHELAKALWATGNFDARNLAIKIADPTKVTSAELDAWAIDAKARLCGGYVSVLAVESPHGRERAKKWLASPVEAARSAGWVVVSQLANRDETLPDSWFEEHLAVIERTIHKVSNSEREAMNGTIIAMGGRNANLRRKCIAAAKRIGPVEVDHGDTACETPDAAKYIEKIWLHADAKKFASPAAQERNRESPRLRC